MHWLSRLPHGNSQILQLCPLQLCSTLLRIRRVLVKPLGEAGTVSFMMLSAFILLCLGVQIVWDGVSEPLRSSLVPLAG